MFINKQGIWIVLNFKSIWDLFLIKLASCWVPLYNSCLVYSINTEKVNILHINIRSHHLFNAFHWDKATLQWKLLIYLTHLVLSHHLGHHSIIHNHLVHDIIFSLLLYIGDLIIHLHLVFNKLMLLLHIYLWILHR